MSKKWLNSDDVLSQYKDGNYQGVTIGIQPVDPSKIIGLSMDYDMVKNDRRMKQLKANVESNGWDDPNPKTLSLIQTPTGEYVVTSGGNHRAVLSNELMLPQIYANVYRIYQISSFTQSILDSVKKLNKEKAELNAYLSKNFNPYSNESLEKVNRLDEIDYEVEQTCLSYLKANNLI